jgi:uncharacterized protein YjbJ (UPF0337 family)
MTPGVMNIESHVQSAQFAELLTTAGYKIDDAFLVGMNIYTLKIQGDWNIAKSKLRQKYRMLTEDDLRYIEGREEELLGRIEKASGALRHEIESFLSDDHNFRLLG